MKKIFLFAVLAILSASTVQADSFRYVKTLEPSGPFSYNNYPFYSNGISGVDYLPLNNGWTPGQFNMQYVIDSKLYIDVYDAEGTFIQQISSELPTIPKFEPYEIKTFNVYHENLNKTHKFCLVYYYNSDEYIVKCILLDEDFNLAFSFDDLIEVEGSFNLSVLLTKNSHKGFSDVGSYIIPVLNERNRTVYLIEWNFDGSNNVNSVYKEGVKGETRYYRLDGTQTESATTGINIKTTIDEQGHAKSQKFLAR